LGFEQDHDNLEVGTKGLKRGIKTGNEHEEQQSFQLSEKITKLRSKREVYKWSIKI
jgi:hypothetical protein